MSVLTQQLIASFTALCDFCTFVHQPWTEETIWHLLVWLLLSPWMWKAPENSSSALRVEVVILEAMCSWGQVMPNNVGAFLLKMQISGLYLWFIKILIFLTLPRWFLKYSKVLELMFIWSTKNTRILTGLDYVSVGLKHQRIEVAVIEN